MTNWNLQILPQKENNEDSDGEKKGTPPGRMEERKVIITGTPEAQWKVSSFVDFYSNH